MIFRKQPNNIIENNIQYLQYANISSKDLKSIIHTTHTHLRIHSMIF